MFLLVVCLLDQVKEHLQMGALRCFDFPKSSFVVCAEKTEVSKETLTLQFERKIVTFSKFV